MDNPYDTPNVDGCDSCPREHPAKPDSCDYPVHTFFTATLFVAMMVFIQWCMLDFYVVCMIPYPEHVHDYNWIALIFPLLAALTLLSRSRKSRRLMSLGVLFSAIALGTVISIPLISMFGVWFHISIGGTL